MPELTNIGVHRVRHGDVTDTTAMVDLLQGDPSPFMVYSDPPWGGGNIKYWATMNKKMTGEVVQPATLNDLLAAVFAVGVLATDYFLIEYGVRWREIIQTLGIQHGFVAEGIVNIVYSSKNLPLDLHLFRKPESKPFPSGYVDRITGTKGYPTVQAAVAPLTQPGDLILDPCCGMGYTAQAAVDYGLRFRGNELNSKRLAKTRARLAV